MQLCTAQKLRCVCLLFPTFVFIYFLTQIFFDIYCAMHSRLHLPTNHVSNVTLTFQDFPQFITGPDKMNKIRLNIPGEMLKFKTPTG